MNIVLDLILVAILVLGVVLGIKRGFVRTAIELAGYVAVLVIAFTISNPVATAIYDAAVRPGIEKSVMNAIPETAAPDVGLMVDEAFGTFPGMVTDLLAGYDITADSVKGAVDAAATDSAEAIAVCVADVVSAAIIAVIRLAFVAVLFLVGLFLVRLIAGACNGVAERLPLVGSVNAWPGGLAGFFKGLAFAFVVANVLMLILTVRSDGLFGITAAQAQDTMLFSRLCWQIPS